MLESRSPISISGTTDSMSNPLDSIVPSINTATQLMSLSSVGNFHIILNESHTFLVLHSLWHSEVQLLIVDAEFYLLQCLHMYLLRFSSCYIHKISCIKGCLVALFMTSTI